METLLFPNQFMFTQDQFVDDMFSASPAKQVSIALHSDASGSSPEYLTFDIDKSILNEFATEYECNSPPRKFSAVDQFQDKSELPAPTVCNFDQDELNGLIKDSQNYLQSVFGTDLNKQMDRREWEKATYTLPTSTSRTLISPNIFIPIFDALDEERKGTVCWRDYIRALSVVVRGREEEKLLFTFRLYGGGMGTLEYSIFRARAEAIIERVWELSQRSMDKLALLGALSSFANALFSYNSFVTFDQYSVHAQQVSQITNAFGLFNYVNYEVNSILANNKPKSHDSVHLTISSPQLDGSNRSTPVTTPDSIKRKRSPVASMNMNALGMTSSPQMNQNGGREKPHPERSDCMCKSCNRIRRNRESARAHQQRKNARIVELETTNKSLQEQITHMKSVVVALQSQNVTLQGRCMSLETQLMNLQSQNLSSGNTSADSLGHVTGTPLAATEQPVV
eukprot:GILK01012555.1.p1 GENE.GILK01012555.1~~GILK01012555.1.p1  ORF type:complete len:452 (-),score=88.97 GILK01012555.1:194-1549(-)